jgi:hypothetical protein
MEHSYIEEHNIAERYLLGKLSVQEHRRFEEHLNNCVQCVNLLEVIDGLRTGLQIVAAKEAYRGRAYVGGGLLARVARLSRATQAVLLTGVILLIAAPILKWSRTRRELIQTTQAAAEWRRKYEESARAARDLMKEMQTRDQLGAKPESEREDLSRLSHKIEKITPPQAVVPVFALRFMRDGDSALAQPVNRIKLSPTSKLIILLLELGPDPGLPSYRAAISTAKGRNIWRKSNLKPNSDNALALSFNSSLFKPGNYLLTLEGLNAQKSYAPTAKYTFGVFTR